MGFERVGRGGATSSTDLGEGAQRAPGRTTLVEQTYGAVQRKPAGEAVPAAGASAGPLAISKPDAGQALGGEVAAGGQEPTLGPEIRPGDGTTAELQAERRRLVNEQSRYHHSAIEPEREQVYNEYTRNIARLDLLLAERGNSALADATIQLRFDGHRLTMTGSSQGSWPAVSGRADSVGAFNYSGERQHQENIGPIPVGEYWVDPSQLIDLRSRWLYSWRYEGAWGTHRITIHPFDTTHTFGRGGFFIHGGSAPGSAGCIDLTSHMAEFARVLGATPPGAKVKLTVAY